jgi:peptidyl-prolyl cis-trans isomerase A (cyclophilin A)
MIRRGILTTGVILLLSALAACGPKPAQAPAKAASASATASASAVTSSSASSSSVSSASDLSSSVYPEIDPRTLPPKVRVAIVTEKGTIVVELEARRAPITTANFLRYVDSGKLAGATFWRAMKSGEAGFVQATSNRIKFPPIKHEPTTQTGLSHTDGTISMARYEVGTTSNSFTISVGDMSYMDANRDPGKGEQNGDNQGYAAFGKVVKGMSVVHKILNGKIARGAAAGEWKGQMLDAPVKIISAKRL